MNEYIFQICMVIGIYLLMMIAINDLRGKK